MSLVLIDTSLWISVLKKGAPGNMIARIQGLLIDGTVASCGMVMLELLGDTRSPKEYRELKEELLSLHFLPVSTDIWLSACHLSFQLRRKGLTIPSTDILIAALALHNDVLIFHSDSHFDLISKHTKLKSEFVK